MDLVTDKTAKKRALFLEAYAKCGVIQHAADAAGIAKQTHFRWMKEDAEYAKQFEAAQPEANSALEDCATRLAMEGNTALIIFLLKNRMPHKYSDRQVLAHTGGDGGPVKTEVKLILVEANNEA